ncbi:Starch-binding associating with outer membrane [bacterium A37T11]|nr:Starch-binding associating with outer membrane [bacterium A37T11]
MSILNKLKVTLKFGSLLLPMWMAGCNSKDFLKEEPKDFLAPDNAYSSVAGLRQGINGLVLSVRDSWYFGEELQDVGTIFKGLGTDVAFYGEDPNSTRFLCNYVTYLTPSSSYVKEYWTRPFKLVQRVNVLLTYIDALDAAKWSNDTQQAAYKAEALFFRAYAYRHLVSFFGDVPVVTEVVSEAKVDFVRNPVSEAYALMEQDLAFATQNLPDPGKEEAPGRVTKGAAWQLLSEVYLAEGKYQDAVTASSHVINDFGYHLMTSRFGSTIDVFGTGDVYLDLFAYGNQNLSENKESIWVMQFEPLIAGGSSGRGTRAFGPAYFRMGNTPDGKKAFRGELINGAYTGYSDTLGRGVSWIRPTNLAAYTVWASDWNNDIRNAKHNIKRDFYFDNPASTFDKKKIDFKLYPASAGRDALRDTCQYIYPFFMKVADPCHVLSDFATSGGGATYKDVYAMRLAETFLTRAEAYIQLGQTDLAANDINAVRERAHAKPVAASQVNMDYLLDERVRELYGEECRHIVLRRTGKLLERVRKYNNNPLNKGLNIQDYNVLWPIPQSQIDLNIGAAFPQNPGYH